MPARADVIGAMLDVWLGEDAKRWPPVLREPFGDADLSMVPLRVGLQADLGLLVAGSERADFPTQTERLLLTVARPRRLLHAGQRTGPGWKAR